MYETNPRALGASSFAYSLSLRQPTSTTSLLHTPHSVVERHRKVSAAQSGVRVVLGRGREVLKQQDLAELYAEKLASKRDGVPCG